MTKLRRGNLRTDTHVVCRRGPGHSFVQDTTFFPVVQSMFSDFTGDLLWLDVGCGPGDILQQLPNVPGQWQRRLHYYACDRAAVHLDACSRSAEKNNIGITWLPYEVTKLPLQPKSPEPTQYHIISLINVLHELPFENIPDLLSALLMRLSPQGLFFIFDQTSLKDDFEPGSLVLSATEAESVLAQFVQAGFKLREIPCNV